MSEIRRCEVCGKRTDFWREVVGMSMRGDNERRRWRTVICSECSRGVTIEEASMQAKDHVTHYTV